MIPLRGQRPSRRTVAAAAAALLVVGGTSAALIVIGDHTGSAMASPSTPAHPGSPTGSATSSAPAATATAAGHTGSRVATAPSSTAHPSASTTHPLASKPATGPLKPGLTRQEAVDQAQAALRSFLAVSDQAYVKADALVPGVSRYADPAVVGEVKGAAADLATQLFRQRGSVSVTKVAAHKVTLGSTPSVGLYACLDLTKIDIVDVNGTVVRAGTALTPRVLNHYELQRAARGWVVSAHTLPNNTAC